MRSSWRLIVCVGVSILTFVSAIPAQADKVEMVVPPGNYQRHLGHGKIADPSGTSHTQNEIAGKVVVAIFSAPNMSQGDRQQKWADLLATNPATKVSDKVNLILVEDMSQAGMFKGMARSSMKKDFTPDSRPFLVVDETGDVLKRFGVPKGSTEIMIYDKTGTLRDVETNLDDEKTTIHRIKVITAKLLAE